MIVRYTKTDLEWTSEYMIELVIIDKHKFGKQTIMEETKEVIGYLHKSHWGRGPHDGVRWEFTLRPCYRSDAYHRHIDVSDRYPSVTTGEGVKRHPLANKYPDTLKEAKSWISYWLMESIMKQCFQVEGE